MPEKEKLTNDSLYDGKLRCKQHSSGYRFSLDAVLLANFILPRTQDKILDLGCGSGIVALILAYRWPSCLLTGLEIQPDLVELGQENVALNGWQERITIQQGDLRHINKSLAAGQFDWVVSNPPYRKSGTGRKNIVTEQQVARHETTADVASVIKASCQILKNKGRAAFIYPATRGAVVLYQLKKQGLEPKRMQIVYSFPGSSASLLLVEALKGGGEELKILPPFYVYQEQNGRYSPEMVACYRS